MAKTVLFTDETGSIQPEIGVTTITVPDWDTPIGFLLKFTRLDDKVTLVRRNAADNGWEPVTDEKGVVELSAKRLDATMTMPDVYGIQGYVKGLISLTMVE